MTKIKCKILLVTSFLFFLYSVVFAQSPLNEDIAQRMSDGRMPGLAICIVKNNRIAIVRGYGWADISGQKPVTPDTIFLMASVSKTITGTALMQLYERGLFRLDDDVNKYLPFSVRNPSFPRNAITFRQLMSHVSSIRDRYTVYDSVYSVGDSSIPLGDFMRDYLVPGRKYFRPQNFYPFAPATQYRYSNVGAALGGYLAERISGINFSEYCSS